MDGVNVQTRRRKRLAVAAASLFGGSCAAVALHQYHLQPPHDSSTATTLQMQLNPNLPLHIKNLIIQSRDITSDTSFVRGSIRVSGSHRKLLEACIDFWHLSIKPDEPSTCTNSGHYPPEWAHTAVLDYMFHVSAGDCCEEMLKPWAGFAGAAGGAPTCAIVDACWKKGGADGGDDVTATDADTANRCSGKAYGECVKDHECKFDEFAIACVVLEKLNEGDGGTSITEIAGSHSCSGKTPKQCVKDAQCEYDRDSNTCGMPESTNSDSSAPTVAPTPASHCNGTLTRKPCIKAGCQFDASTDTCHTAPTSAPSLISQAPVTPPGDYVATDDNNSECDGKKYHPLSVVERKCSNDDVFPSMWSSEPSKYFFTSAADCCAAFYSDGPSSCDVVNICARIPSAWDDYCSGKSRKQCIKDSLCDYDVDTCLGREGDAQEKPEPEPPTNSPTAGIESEAPTTPYPTTSIIESEAPITPYPTTSMPITPYPTTSMPITPYPTTSMPSTRIPTNVPSVPVTPQPTSLANDGSAINPKCYEKEWHISRVPGSQYTCTNDKNYPEAWLHPSMKEYFMFKTSEECCDTNFNTPECDLYDVCMEGTDPPTDGPSTTEPTPNPWPTYGPSVKPLYAISETTCKARWHVSTKKNVENTCTNDSDFPKSWASPDKRDIFFYVTANECCQELYPNVKCNLVNICPVGGVADTLEPTEMPTEAPKTPKPAKKKSPAPTPKPTKRPASRAPWYVDRTSGKCVQNCSGPSPCGGPRPQWEDQYSTVQACCDSMPWKAFEVCLATPSPTGDPPTAAPTDSPVARPTKMPTQRPTRRPTASPTTAKPTKAPTPVPTVDCSVYKWHMSTEPGEEQTCTNSEEFPAAWLDNAQFFLHDTSENCCQKVFGGDCQLEDWCTELNEVKAGEANQGGGENQGGGPTVDCSVYKWHMSTDPGELQTCTNSEDFPSAWLDNAEFFLHDTSKNCCQKAFGGTDCQVKDWCAEHNQVKGDETNQGGGGNQGSGSEDSSVFNGGEDDFEGDGTIPWVLGDPPEWKIDDTMAFSGTQSITNIQTTKVSATSTLTLKLNLSTPATFSCKLKLDVAMPFERFSFEVNGEQRNAFYQPADEWFDLLSGIAPGESTLQFRVTNGDMFPNFDRSMNADRYGTGHVWLDQCDISVTS